MESFVDRVQMVLCIVMRFCDGGDLAQYIKTRDAAQQAAGAQRANKVAAAAVWRPLRLSAAV